MTAEGTFFPFSSVFFLPGEEAILVKQGLGLPALLDPPARDQVGDFPAGEPRASLAELMEYSGVVGAAVVDRDVGDVVDVIVVAVVESVRDGGAGEAGD